MQTAYGRAVAQEYRTDGTIVARLTQWRLASKASVLVYLPPSPHPGSKVRAAALDTAKECLVWELRRLPETTRREIAKVLASKGDIKHHEEDFAALAQTPEDFVALAQTPEELWLPLATNFVELLISPPGAYPVLHDHLEELELQTRSRLFWRCLIALLSMPLASLAAMAKRRTYAGKAGVLSQWSTEKKKIAYARVVLPWFSMLCKTDAQMANEKQRQSARRTHDGSSKSTASKMRATKNDPKKNKAASAAKHTYDIGYKKWDKFDPDSKDKRDVELNDCKQSVKSAAKRKQDATSAAERELDSELARKLGQATPEMRAKLKNLGIFGDLVSKTKDITDLDATVNTSAAPEFCPPPPIPESDETGRLLHGGSGITSRGISSLDAEWLGKGSKCVIEEIEEADDHDVQDSTINVQDSRKAVVISESDQANIKKWENGIRQEWSSKSKHGMKLRRRFYDETELNAWICTQTQKAVRRKYKGMC